MTRQEALLRLLQKEVSHPTLLQFDFENDEELFSPELDRARLNLKQGSYEIAYNHLKELQSQEPLANRQQHIQSIIFRCLEGIENLFLIASIAQLREDLMLYRQHDYQDGRGIRRLCIKLLHFRYNNEGEIYSLEQIAADGFLLDCLANDFYPDPHVEKFLTDIRRQLLLSSIQKEEINEDYLPLYQALALQGYLTEYVFSYREDEEAVVRGLNEDLGHLLGEDECDLTDISNMLLLLAMYRPLFLTNAYPALEGLETQQLPDFLQNIFALTYLEVSDLNRKLTQVITLGEIQGQAKTEASLRDATIFPRYSRLRLTESKASYSNRYPEIRASAGIAELVSNDPLEILVADCSTGFNALEIADSCRGASVTAVDLSKTRLAYAKRIKSAYNISNIEFFQSDLKELPNVFKAQKQRFHIIDAWESFGGYVSIDDTVQSLLQLLKPDGLLRIGLKSRRANRHLVKLRGLVAKLGIRQDSRYLREFRKQILHKELGQDLLPVLSNREFYSMSGCRDLLFGSSRNLVTIPQIKSLLHRNRLEFLGFEFFCNDMNLEYSRLFPADRNRLNLDYWHQLEQQIPDAFRYGYRFHCRRISSPQ